MLTLWDIMFLSGLPCALFGLVCVYDDVRIGYVGIGSSLMVLYRFVDDGVPILFILGVFMIFTVFLVYTIKLEVKDKEVIEWLDKMLGISKMSP